ncbi:MAG: PEP-CTERM sorting domain-containing protein [Desulfuromonadales bacterium]
MKKKVLLILAVFVLATSTAMATQINNTSLSGQFTAGIGNSNQHFAVDNNNGVEVGLKAKLRYVGDVIPVGNIYNVPAGYQASPTTYANWNFDFSVFNLRSDTFVTFKYDVDPTANIFYKTLTIPSSALSPLFQDSWNYGMGFLGTGFNANQNGTYDIDLSVSSVTGALLADSHIQVVVGDGAAPVPEPGTIMLLGAGVAALAFWKRKKS